MRFPVKHFILIGAICVLAAMGKKPEPSIGDACALLEAVDPSDYLGAAPSYSLNMTTGDFENWGNCTATSADGEKWISFTVEESLLAPSKTSVELRDAYMADQIKSEEDNDLYATADFAEAAMWEKMFQMLVFWGLDGRVKFSLKTQPSDTAAVESIAGRIIANLP